MPKCACDKSGEPEGLSLVHIESYTKWKKRQKQANEESDIAEPRAKRVKLTKKQKEALADAAASAERAQKAKILDHNRVLTKVRFVVEATNQTAIKTFKRFTAEANYQHAKTFDDDLKSACAVWNMFGWDEYKWLFEREYDDEDLTEVEEICPCELLEFCKIVQF